MGKEDVNKGEINVRNGGQSLIVKKKGKASVKQINTTIINNNDNTTTNSTKPKKASLKTVLILIASVFIIFLIANIIYKTNMSNANYSKNNGEYLQAAKYYHDALAIPKVLIFSKISSEEVECMEADCYFLRALKEKDDDIARKYYARAGGIYGKIINNEKSKGTKVYIEALAGLSHVYQYSGHAIDEKWKNLINILENEAQKFNKTILNNKEDINTAEIPIYHWAKVYSAIGDFYYTLIQRDYAFMTDPNIVHSALVSYENYDKLINLAKKDEEVANLLNDDSMYYDMIKAELMILIARSPYTKDPDQYATQAIELCQSYLKDASTKGIESEESISLKAFIADGYRVLGEYYSDNEEVSKEYMKKAYDELKKILFKLENEKVQLSLIIDVGYSAIFTGLCSNEDLKKVLDNYQKLLSQYNIRENPQETARYSLNICDACVAIIELYGYSQQAWEMGQYISEEVKNVEEYVQESQRERFQEYYDYFHQDTEENMQNSIR